MTDPRPRTAVLHQFTGIGDLIWHLRYFKAVAEQSQGGRVTVIAQPSTMARNLIGREPWVDEVIDHDHRPRRGERRGAVHAGLGGMWRMARLLKSRGFDRLVMFSGRPSRGLLGALSGIPERTAYGYHWLQRIFLTHGPFIPRYTGDAVAVSREAAAFAIAHGFCQEPLVPRLDIPQAELAQMTQRLAHLPRPLATLAIGTSEPRKQWGIDKFAELARQLTEQGLGVVVLGGKAEREQADRIVAGVPGHHQPHVLAITDATVPGSAAAIHLSQVCVGNDTGMVHVAAAVERPVIVILGPRPALDHDPLITSITGPSVQAIEVQAVLSALRHLKLPSA